MKFVNCYENGDTAHTELMYQNFPFPDAKTSKNMHKNVTLPQFALLLRLKQSKRKVSFKISELAQDLCKKQSVKSIDFSRFILPYGPFSLRLIRSDGSSKLPISTLIPRPGSSVATCFYKLVPSCQKVSLSKILWYYYHCTLDLCFSVRSVFTHMMPCWLVIFI
jgi:hypothetical protein